MDALEACITFRTLNHSEWFDFIDDIVNACVNNKEFKKALDKFYYYKDTLDGLADIFEAELRDDLEKYPFTTGLGIGYIKDDFEYFLTELIQTIDASLKESVDIYIEDSEDYHSIGEDDEINPLNDRLSHVIEDSDELAEYFTFSTTDIPEKIRSWRHSSIIILPGKANIIIPSPIITLKDYFDPTIYDLIKKQPELLKTMDWRVFEEMLADILRHFGYDVELTRATKDGGIDVIAIRKDSHFGVHKYLLQAKRYNNAVEVSPVRELLFLQNEHMATKSCLATTATFTKGAWELAAKHRWHLELKDRDGIMQWIDDVLKIKNKSR